MALQGQRGRKMTESELEALVKNEIQNSISYTNGQISESRRKALKYYYMDKFGNEIAGRSEFVSSDVQDVVEAVMPDLMEIFGSGESAVDFQPQGEEDEDGAKQATDYVNHIWFSDNPGWITTHDWIKDAILQKNGIIRFDWDSTPREERITRSRVPVSEMMGYLDDPSVEIVEQEEVAPETPEEIMVSMGQPLFDVQMVKTHERGRVVIQGLPPEEFLIKRRSTDIDGSTFCCHKKKTSESELLEMGYPEALVESIPSEDEQKYNEERLARFNYEDEWPDDLKNSDRAAREIWLYDCYMRIDFDGDGRTELWNIVCAGPGYNILPDPRTDELAIEVDFMPFADITPIRVPHKFFGRSLYELCQDIQYIKSTVVRQILDNAYFINNQRRFVNERVMMDDWLTNRPGGAIRVKGTGPVADATAPVETQSIGTSMYPLIEYLDGVRENRTGVNRHNFGKDHPSLNPSETLGGLMEMLDEGAKRTLMIARLFAEIGFRPAFRKILRLVANNQDIPRTIRLRGKWVPVDPQTWNADMDATPRVGLGHGTRRARVVSLERLAALQEKMIQYQGGVTGPMVTLSEVSNLVESYVNATGHRPARLYFREPTPEDQQMVMQQAAQPNPEIELKKAEEERRRQEATWEHEREMLKIQLQAQEKQIDIEEVRARLAQDTQSKLLESQTKLMTTEMQTDAQMRSSAVQSGAQLVVAASNVANQGNGKEGSKS